jgi:rhodanese-related sulfurtransferase
MGTSLTPATKRLSFDSAAGSASKPDVNELHGAARRFSNGLLGGGSAMVDELSEADSSPSNSNCSSSPSMSLLFPAQHHYLAAPTPQRLVQRHNSMPERALVDRHRRQSDDFSSPGPFGCRDGDRDDRVEEEEEEDDDEDDEDDEDDDKPESGGDQADNEDDDSKTVVLADIEGAPANEPMMVRSSSAPAPVSPVDEAAQENDAMLGQVDAEAASLLPVVCDKRHRDRVSADTVARLLRGGFRERVARFVIVDCRFDYEYSGGHIAGAINVNRRADVLRLFDEQLHFAGNIVIIFHCEYSSQRAPRNHRCFREIDRARNLDLWPRLTFPNTYILDGGYRGFFERHPDLCRPNGYVSMFDPKFQNECRRWNKICNDDWEPRNQIQRGAKRSRADRDPRCSRSLDGKP